MLVITGTRHSGTLFLSSTLQTAGFNVVSRKKVLSAGKPPVGSMVAMPISKLKAVCGKADYVVALIRPWRAWCSVMTDEESDPAIPHEVSWFLANYELACTLMRSGVRFQLLSHDRLLSRPELSIKRVLQFVGRAAAFDQVLLLPAIAPAAPSFGTRVFARDEMQVVDEFWSVVHNEKPMTRRLFQRMSVLQETLVRRFPDGGGIEPMAARELQSKVPA